MIRGSVLCEQYAAQAAQTARPSQISSPISSLGDPRFSQILTRASNERERLSRHQVSPTDLIHSPSMVTVNSNAWLPPSGKNTKTGGISATMKGCFTTACKNRLIGLLIGLGIAAISTGVAVGVLLTRPSSLTTTDNSACSSLRWEEYGVVVAGNGTSGSEANQITYASDMHVDSSNAIYVADSNNHRVQKFMPNSSIGITVAGITGVSGSNSSLLNYPTAVTTDADGNLYVADSYGITVWPVGILNGTRLPGSSGLGSCYGIFVDADKNVYASYTYGCVIRMWTPTATASTIVAGNQICGLSLSQLYYPYCFTVDSLESTIYISNYYSHTIMTWQLGATNGTIIHGVNNTDGSLQYLLRYPTDVKRDQQGNLYVADAANNRVILYCSNSPDTSARIIAGMQFNYPLSIALDSNRNLYVLDSNLYRVLKFNRIG
ncbi:unnamed protein product [Adineta ricciae]|uniref:NHL repeat containing protein n=1 Tax=Adineta ricciae TaxID=249248 RepID=A0A815EI61_ADIRI|nr:unnamed protein product [Adineta ricciae]